MDKTSSEGSDYEPVRMRIESAKITAHKEQVSRENSARQLVMFSTPDSMSFSAPSPLACRIMMRSIWKTRLSKMAKMGAPFLERL